MPTTLEIVDFQFDSLLLQNEMETQTFKKKTGHRLTLQLTDTTRELLFRRDCIHVALTFKRFFDA